MKKIQIIGLLLMMCVLPTMAENAQKKQSENPVGGHVTATLKSGDTYTIAAVAHDGYRFLYWMHDDQAEQSFDYTLDTSAEGNAQTFQAVFGKISAIAQDHGTIDVSTSDAATLTFTLTAKPTSCASYVWNTDYTTALSKTYQEKDGDVMPLFKVGKINTTAGSAVTGGSIQADTTECGVTLTAVPADGYTFVGWEDNSMANPREIDLTSDIHITYSATFTDGVAMVGSTAYPTIQAAVNAAANNTVTILASTDEDIIISSKVTLDANNKQIGDITITKSGDLHLASAIQIADLYLTSTMSASSQLHDLSNLTFANAYYDLQLEPGNATAASPDKWYAFAVPFEVDIEAGIHRASAPSTALISTKDFLIWEYDGQMRADNKENGWKQLLAGTLKPGNFYMIGIDGTENLWRFTKSGNWGASMQNISVKQYESDVANRGWNALSNPWLVYANASVSGVYYAQVYDNASNSGKYTTTELSSNTFVMACPFFIQVENTTPMVLEEPSMPGTLNAPMRESTNKIGCKLTLSSAAQSDVLYLTTGEDATSSYQIGKDLIKIMGGNMDSYVWSNAYGYKLSAQHAPLNNDVAEFAITMFAPIAQTYTLHASDFAEDIFAYLVLGDIRLADLTKSDYTIDLSMGTTNGYVIQIGERKISNDIHSVGGDNKIIKYIKDNQLYIQIDNAVYNAMGSKL